MTTEEHRWESILNHCATDEQPRVLEVVRDLCKTRLRESSDRRELFLFYKDVRGVEVAVIRLKAPGSNPEIIIKLPWITNDPRKSSTQSKRYGFQIQPDGQPLDLGKVYNVKNLRINRRKGNKLLSTVAERLLGEKVPPENFEKLIALINFMLEKQGA